MYYFCTLFDRNYLFKGLSLYQSLRKTCHSFTLYILCMDDLTRSVLAALNLNNVRLISIAEFEDEALRSVKPKRSVAEYCWTCTPSLLLYVLATNPEIDLITYLDADLLFFSSPDPVFTEFASNSIMIIEHRFPAHLRYLEANGIYNVEMVAFRLDENGVECLTWWRERCLEWCFNRLEDGRLGDQKYLDDWPTRFAGVHVLRHLGAGVAPWNVEQYDVTEVDDRIMINGYPLVFYHFHQFYLLPNQKYFCSSSVYSRNRAFPMAIYSRYIEEIEQSVATVQQVAPGFSYGIERSLKIRLRAFSRAHMPRPLKNFLKRLRPVVEF